MAFFTHEDVSLYYVKEGKGHPVVFISGLGSKNSWKAQIPYFREKMTVIALHNRGTGKSSRPNYPYTMQMYVEDVRSLLDFLDIEEQIHLCGVSMGGMITQHFALSYPEKVKTLILVATSAKLDPSNIIESQELMKNASLKDRFSVYCTAVYSREFRRKLKKDDALYEMLYNDFAENATMLQDYINQAAAIYDHDTRNSLHLIRQPTLILTGDDDHLITGLEHSRLLHNKIPNSELEIIKDSGHGLIMEKDYYINEKIWNFIDKNLN